MQRGRARARHCALLRSGMPRACVRDLIICAEVGVYARARARLWSICVTTSLKRADVSVSLSGGDHPKGFGVTSAYLSLCVSWRRC